MPNKTHYICLGGLPLYLHFPNACMHVCLHVSSLLNSESMKESP